MAAWESPLSRGNWQMADTPSLPRPPRHAYEYPLPDRGTHVRTSKSPEYSFMRNLDTRGITPRNIHGAQNAAFR